MQGSTFLNTYPYSDSRRSTISATAMSLDSKTFAYSLSAQVQALN